MRSRFMATAALSMTDKLNAAEVLSMRKSNALETHYQTPNFLVSVEGGYPLECFSA